MLSYQINCFFKILTFTQVNVIMCVVNINYWVTDSLLLLSKDTLPSKCCFLAIVIFLWIVLNILFETLFTWICHIGQLRCLGISHLWLPSSSWFENLFLFSFFFSSFLLDLFLPFQKGLLPLHSQGYIGIRIDEGICWPLVNLWSKSMIHTFFFISLRLVQLAQFFKSYNNNEALVNLLYYFRSCHLCIRSTAVVIVSCTSSTVP